MDEFSLTADDALEDPADDQLGYDEFARHLAEVIQRNTPADFQLDRRFAVFSFWYALESEDASDWLETNIEDTEGLLQCLYRLFIAQKPS